MPRPSPDDMVLRYEEAKRLKSPFENDFKLCAAYCLPRHYDMWQFDGPAILTSARTGARRFAYDSTGIRSVPKFRAILQRICTPDGQRWNKLGPTGPASGPLMRSQRVKQYFHDMTELLFKLRYSPRSHFRQMTSELYTQLGVYGMGPNRLTWRRKTTLDPQGGYFYKSCHVRDIFVLVDGDGLVVTIFYRFWLTARQFQKQFPDDTPPRSIALELEKATGPSDTTFFEFVHCVWPRDEMDYDEQALDYRRHPISSSFLAVKDKQYVGAEGGYRSYPYLVPRSYSEPGDIYGYSPAQQALPALGTASAQKKSILKAGQKATDPTLLANDDGVLSGKMGQAPGHVIYGGINASGQEMVKPLQMGRFDVAIEMMQDERMDIKDAFLVTLFEILAEDRERMTIPEVVERMGEKASLAAPTMGMMQSEQFGPEIEREIQLLAENAPQLMPEMPPELQEAQGEYTVEYTSPLAKGLYAEEDAGFMRVWELAVNHAAQTGDRRPLHRLKMDTAIPQIADHLAVRPDWIASDEEVEALVAEDQKQQELALAAKAAPAMASVATAAMGAGRDNKAK